MDGQYVLGAVRDKNTENFLANKGHCLERNSVAFVINNLQEQPVN